MMDVVEFESIDNNEIKCGEMFLTISGSIKFLCTLCLRRYECFQDCVDHIMREHYDFNRYKEGTSSNEFVKEEEELCETFIEDYDPESILCAEMDAAKNALRENEILIEELGHESTLDVVLDKFQVKQNDSTYVDINNGSDTPSNATSYGSKTNNLDKTTMSKTQSRRRMSSKPLQKPLFKCTECDFSSKVKSNLIRHMKRHSNRKPYQCSECQKEFYTHTELKSHFRTHTGERPFLCTDCGKTFFTSGILSAHIKRHRNICDKECPICQERFFDAATLITHMRIHTGEFPFKCKLCSASFKRRNALVSHIKIHENKREHQCEICPAMFIEKHNLNKHRRSKHPLTMSEQISKTEHIN